LNGTGDGQQYHQDPAQSHNGLDTFNSFQMIQNSTQGTTSTNRNQWNSSPTQIIESEQMSRLPSQESTGAHAQSANFAPPSYDQSGSSGLFATMPQVPYISSSRSDVTGRSSPVDSGLYSPSQLAEIQAFDTYPFQGSEDVSGGQTIFHRDSVNGLPHSSVSMTAGSSFSMFTNADNPFASLSDGPHNLASHVPVSQDFDPSTMIDSHSPTTWNENIVLESQRSSPTLLEDLFQPRPQMMTSATNSPLNYSPTLEGLSPRYVQDSPDLVDLAPYTTGDRVKRPGGPRHSKVVSDLASRQQRHQGTSETSDESFGMVGRSSLEIDNTARDHPLYQNVTAQADGFYHCPWQGQEGCQHKPEKLKCNYEYDPFQIFSRPCPMLTTSSLASKFVDSHLKPYRCKVNACENSRFSSTACLLRHEREAHAMHGHGDKPYLCTYNDCERGVTGNGFPRHWNLRDHMKRVHNDPGTSTKSNVNGSAPPPNPHARNKKRKVEANDDPYVEKASKREL
jgi:hypothetical protein